MELALIVKFLHDSRTHGTGDKNVLRKITEEVTLYTQSKAWPGFWKMIS